MTPVSHRSSLGVLPEPSIAMTSVSHRFSLGVSSTPLSSAVTTRSACGRAADSPLRRDTSSGTCRRYTEFACTQPPRPPGPTPGTRDNNPARSNSANARCTVRVDVDAISANDDTFGHASSSSFAKFANANNTSLCVAFGTSRCNAQFTAQILTATPPPAPDGYPTPPAQEHATHQATEPDPDPSPTTAPAPNNQPRPASTPPNANPKQTTPSPHAATTPTPKPDPRHQPNQPTTPTTTSPQALNQKPAKPKQQPTPTPQTPITHQTPQHHRHQRQPPTHPHEDQNPKSPPQQTKESANAQTEAE